MFLPLRSSTVNVGLGQIIESLCPYQALAKQKRFMRRYMRKPADMKTRVYVNYLVTMNQQELPHLPPFNAGQGLSNDELIDIVLYGVPKKWIHKMDEHDFDPMTKSLDQLTQFCERMEAAETHDTSAFLMPEGGKPSGKKSSSKKYKASGNTSDSRSGKWCHYHEVDTHNTSECETLKRLKANSKEGSSGKSKNRTWVRKSEDAKKLTKKELSAIGKKAAHSAIKKAKAECHAVAKRKSDEDESSVSSADTADNSVNMMEKMAAVDKQLADFDFSEEGEVSC